MEFALDPRLAIYAGGLGVLAGDFLRSARNLGASVVGVGIAWSGGYTAQSVGADGARHDQPVPLDRRWLVRQAPTVRVTIGGSDVELAIFRVDAFDNAPLYLLEPTSPRHRWITRRLYGGGDEDRVAQEIVLGVGGVRALDALGIAIDRYHFNEGHAVFAGLELLRRERARGLSPSAARAAVNPRVVFTTHTPIDAGNERHDIERLVRLGANGGSDGLDADELAELGGRPFNMTVAGLRLSSRANAVAEQHGRTARRMWRATEGAAPICAITNGVDARRWQDPRVAAARDPRALDAARAACKAELLARIEKSTNVRFFPDRLLIGFARRATAYKRPTLLFHDRPRAEALLAEGRVQLVFAGKAHPRDAAGRALVAEMLALAERHRRSVVFVPDYDLELGALLTRGCDVWLNTPRRPLEACGTSGMKAAMNGVLNLSILDGWWAEGCEHGVNGWRIGASGGELEEAADGDDDTDVSGGAEGDPVADTADARALHDLLTGEVLPMYEGNRAQWSQMMRASIDMAIARFSSDRMVREYYARLYAPEPARQVG